MRERGGGREEKGENGERERDKDREKGENEEKDRGIEREVEKEVLKRHQPLRVPQIVMTSLWNY